MNRHPFGVGSHVMLVAPVGGSAQVGERGIVRDASWSNGVQVAWYRLHIKDSDPFIYPCSALKAVEETP